MVVRGPGEAMVVREVGRWSKTGRVPDAEDEPNGASSGRYEFRGEPGLTTNKKRLTSIRNKS